VRLADARTVTGGRMNSEGLFRLLHGTVTDLYMQDVQGSWEDASRQELAAQMNARRSPRHNVARRGRLP
jgi:hypothetical protein